MILRREEGIGQGQAFAPWNQVILDLAPHEDGGWHLLHLRARWWPGREQSSSLALPGRGRAGLAGDTGQRQQQQTKNVFHHFSNWLALPGAPRCNAGWR